MKKVLRFEFSDESRPPEDYTLIFGDYVLVQWPDSGSPYWHPREVALARMETEPQAYIVQSGTVYSFNSGCYYTDEAEFMQCMKMLRAELVKGTSNA